MKKTIMYSLLALQAISIFIFIYFDFVNFTPLYADLGKYATIILSFVTAVIFLRDSVKLHDGIFLAVGLGLTVIIDYFLVIAKTFSTSTVEMERNHVIGMTLYCVCQCVYFFRFQKPKKALIIPIFLIIPLILNFIIKLDTLIVVTSFYIQILLTNIFSAVFAIKHKKFPKMNSILIMIGMFIFVLGDISVVLTFFRIDIFRKMIWLFYTPSQIFLSFSALNFEVLKRRKSSLQSE